MIPAPPHGSIFTSKRGAVLCEPLFTSFFLTRVPLLAAMANNLSLVAVGVSAQSTASYRQRGAHRHFAGVLLATTPRALSDDNRQVSAVLHEDSRPAHGGPEVIAPLKGPLYRELNGSDMPITRFSQAVLIYGSCHLEDLVTPF